MSTYMVQENHQEKLKQKLFEYAIPLYFFWVILDHPVHANPLYSAITGKQDPLFLSSFSQNVESVLGIAALTGLSCVISKSRG